MIAVCSTWRSPRFQTVSCTIRFAIETNQCQQSLLIDIPILFEHNALDEAGLGMFAGTFFHAGELLGRVGDAAFPVVDQDWHNSPETDLMHKA